MKNFLNILLFVLIFIPNFADAKSPKDFKFVYYGTAGQVAQGTNETITVQGKEVIVKREARELGGSRGKTQAEFRYPVTEAQLEKLVQIIRGSEFMAWPKTPEVSHESNANEFIEVELEGKKAKHNKWEQGNQEKFRILYNRFNDWFTDIRSVRF